MNLQGEVSMNPPGGRLNEPPRGSFNEPPGGRLNEPPRGSFNQPSIKRLSEIKYNLIIN